MNSRNATFYFANLASDVMRCIAALERGDENRYQASRTRAGKTLAALRTCRHPEAYEEGLLLLRALTYARSPDTLSDLRFALDRMIAELSFK